jgi:hypothetical protein
MYFGPIDMLPDGVEFKFIFTWDFEAVAPPPDPQPRAAPDFSMLIPATKHNTPTWEAPESMGYHRDRSVYAYDSQGHKISEW